MVTNKTEKISTGVNNFFQKSVQKIKSSLNYCWNGLLLLIQVLVMFFGGCVLYVLSPVLFFFGLFINPAGAANFYYSHNLRDEFKNIHSVSDAFDYIKCTVSALFYYTWRFLWVPVVYILPMNIRHYFIDTSQKPLKEYTVQTQMDYVLYMLNGGKPFSWSISDEAFSALWNSEKLEEYRIFRNAWVASGANLGTAQIDSLLKDNKDEAIEMLLKYFTTKTRKDEQMNLLLTVVPINAQLIQLIKSIVEVQKPSTNFIEAVYSSPHDELKQKLQSILDEWADIDAVSTDKTNSKVSLEQAKTLWKNFCLCKQKIATSAQAKMKFWQYQIFTETHHHLDEVALKHLIATLDGDEYLELIIRHEGFDKVEAPDVMAILQSRRNYYAVYMKMKVNAVSLNKAA